MDHLIINWFNSVIGSSLALDLSFVFFAKYLPYLFVLFLALVIIRMFDSKNAITLGLLLTLVAILSKGIIVSIFRYLHYRPRPFTYFDFNPLLESLSSSFPSGHTSFFFGIVFFLIFIPMINKKFDIGFWKWVFLSAAFLISIARISSLIHWPTDVIAGILVGIISALVVLLVSVPIVSKKIFQES